MTEKRQSPRILHVAKACFPDVGGIETVVRQLAEGAFKQGYEVSVLCCGEKTVVEEFAGVTVYRYKPFFNVGSAPLSFHFMLKLWQLLKRHDIVHFHIPNPIGELGFCLFSLFNKRSSLKNLCTHHADPVKPKAFMLCYTLLLKWFMGVCSQICATSTKHIKTSYILRSFAPKCKAIPLSVDVDRFSKVSTEKINEAEMLVAGLPHPRILFCGRFAYFKGLSYLLRAVSDIPECSLILVGDGKMRPEVEQQIDYLHLRDRVALPGMLTGELYRAFYHVADVFVLPSTYPESFGIVGLEAMAAGLPLVTTELGTGTSFYNVDGETGFVVPPMDPNALAEAIKKLLTDRELASRMGFAARKRADDFDLSRMLGSYLDLYDDLLSGAVGRGSEGA